MRKAVWSAAKTIMKKIKKNKDEIRWEFLDKELDKETEILLKGAEKFIVKTYGKRCKIFAPHCPVCRVWIALDNLRVNL